jgi:hypothetical protein
LGQEAQDRGDQRGVRSGLPGLALKQPRLRVDDKGVEHVFGLGEIQGPLEGPAGGTLRIAILRRHRDPGRTLRQTGLADPRPQQHRLSCPGLRRQLGHPPRGV